MTNINANKDSLIKQAEKRLNRRLTQLENIESLTALERNQLYIDIFTDLLKIKLYEIELRDKP